MAHSRKKPTVWPTIAGTTSEDEFWRDDPFRDTDYWVGAEESLRSGDNETTPTAGQRPSSSRRTRSRHSPRKRVLVEKGIGATNLVTDEETRNQDPSSKGKGPSVYRRVGEVALSTFPSKTSISSFRSSDGYDTDEDEVDQMLQVDTDVEVDSESLSALSSRKPSFEFSEPSVSRLTSFTSVESNIPAVKAPATGRKRTYEYPNPDGPPSPLSPSKKRASQSESALGGTAAGCSISFPPPRLHITPQTRTRPPSPSKPSPADVSPSRRDRWMKEIQEALADTAKVGEDPSRVDVTPRATIASAAPSRGPSFRGPFRSSKDVAANTSSGARARQAGPIEPPNCSIIAHDRKVQQMMDVKRISWGVQYELARGVCSGRWQWNDVTAKKLDTLRGTDSEAAPRVESVMLDANVSRGAYAASLPLWVELDREQAALEEGTSRGLGLRGEWKGDPNWYGGKIRQIASVVESGDGFVLRLKSMMKRKSNRFARYLGSRRMLQVKLPDDKLMRKRGDDVRRFMQSKFVLCGRVFAAFAAKDGKVFLMETKEDYDRTADGADRSRMSVEELVQWHNPLDCNSNQPVTKWVTRFDLGLSDTVPALAFRGEGVDIFYIDDETAPHAGGKVPAEKILTDGCGFMNWAALAAIARALKYTRFPTAVQGRIAGSKGVWTLHPHDRSPDDPPRIWVRPSQQKIKHLKLTLSHCIFELVAPPRVSVPSRLSRHTLMVLSHNAVSDEALVSLMEAGIDEEVRALSAFDDPHLLRATVAEVGRIFAARLQRLASGSARLFGLGREWGQDSDQQEEEEDPEHGQLGTLVDRNEYSGEPVKVHERASEMLAAGFRPQENPILFKSLRDIISYRITELIREYHITVPRSADAFIVPDPYGVLEPGEIHFRASDDLKDPLDGPGANQITGNVLVYRNPARLPADIQKVSAVAHPMLSDYVDVIVFPTKGPRSLASLLAGGDYDGDTCVCIYDELLVQSFEGSATTDPPENFLKDNFQSQEHIQQVSEVLEDMKSCSTSMREPCLQQALLVGMISPNVGQYSVFHENSAYLYGLAHKHTLHNAWMFNTVLDSKKTGLIVKESVFHEDTNHYGHAQPPCMKPIAGVDEETEQGHLGYTRPCPQRDRGLPPFILDQLLTAGKALETRFLQSFETLQPTLAHSFDVDLSKPWADADSWATRLQEQRRYAEPRNDLQQIHRHVEKHVRLWQLAAGKSTATPSRTRRKRTASVAKPSDDFKLIAKSFADGPENVVFYDVKTICTLKASCAYKTNPKFAFSVAFYDLCRIKAESFGIAPQTREFADMMAVPSSVRRILTQKASGL